MHIYMSRPLTKELQSFKKIGIRCDELRSQITQWPKIQVGKVSTNFAAAKNGKVSSNFSAAKNGQVSSNSKKR